MPFRSRSQARYMYSQHPEIAKEFSAATPSIKALPDKASSRPAEKAKSPDTHEAKKRHR